MDPRTSTSCKGLKYNKRTTSGLNGKDMKFQNARHNNV